MFSNNTAVYVTSDGQPLPVVMEDAPIHTDIHPFCGNETCPCHSDPALIRQYLSTPLLNGLLTPEEASRTFYNRQI
jgi:hypothetical protein